MPKRNSPTSYPDDDLFERTKMTFGEHLEELRRALFKSVVGLVIGCCIGFAFGKSVVRLIKKPLSDALSEHYAIKAEEELERTYGHEMPEDIRKFIQRTSLTYEDVFIEENEWNRLRGLEFPQGTEVAPAPEDEVKQLLPAPDARMIKTRLWRRIEPNITTLNAQEAFMIWVKASFMAGIVIASPYVFYQVWNFIAAGLYPHEKRYVYIFLPMSMVLFWSGALLAFFIGFGYVLSFLLSFNRSMGLETEPRLSEWLSFALLLPLGFGVSFQMPLVMLFLQRVGIFSVPAYLGKWRIAVLIIFILAMVLTPSTDPITMLLMALPLTALYFLGIGLCLWMPRGRSPFAEAYEPA